ncbi:MAG: GNAT family N-acetyltransferase [Clostridia bacterium]|nr:GNAT family N-acetyltransferase [Clostridia bacterium]
MRLLLRLCKKNDIEKLKQIGIKTFYETYAESIEKSNIEVYINQEFDDRELQRQIESTHTFYYLAYSQGEIIGYMKINDTPGQTILKDPDSLEIEKLYLLHSHQGCDYGNHLLKRATDIAAKMGKKYLWLRVMECNKEALGFFEKQSFKIVSTNSFFMGYSEKRNFMMRKNLI